MKPSSGDKQLGMLSPLKSAAMQSGQTNHPSQNEVGLDVSHHIHLSLEGRGKYFFLDILFASKILLKEAGQAGSILENRIWF